MSNPTYPDFEIKQTKTTLSVLQQWAKALELKTKGLVIGEIKSLNDREGDYIIHKFILNAPLIGKQGYNYSLFAVRELCTSLFPITLFHFQDEEQKEIENIEELDKRIREIAFDKRTKNIIETLIIRSNKTWEVE